MTDTTDGLMSDLELAAKLAEEPVPVHVALARVKAEVGAVPKTREADARQGGYRFRGIEAVLGAVQAPMARHGVVMVPEDLKLVKEEWHGYSGSGWWMTRVKIRWTIIGPAGDKLVAVNWGEALDNGDKGLGKARSYAQKDLLIRLLELPTDDPGHGDTENTAYPTGGRPEPEPTVELATPVQILEVLEWLDTYMEANAGEYPPGWREARAQAGRPGTYARDSLYAMTIGDRPPAPAEALAIMHRHLEAQYEQPAADPEPDTSTSTSAHDEHEPCSICGSTRANRVDHDGVWRCADPKGCAKRTAELAADQAAATPPSADPECAAGDGPIAAEELSYDDQDRPVHIRCNPTLQS